MPQMVEPDFDDATGNNQDRGSMRDLNLELSRGDGDGLVGGP